MPFSSIYIYTYTIYIQLNECSDNASIVSDPLYSYPPIYTLFALLYNK